MRVSSSDVDDGDVKEIDPGRYYHQGEGETERCSSFTGPLSFLPAVKEIGQTESTDRRDI